MMVIFQSLGTPTHVAAEFGNPEILEALIVAGANVNAADEVVATVIML